MIRRPPISTRNGTLFTDTTVFRSSLADGFFLVTVIVVYSTVSVVVGRRSAPNVRKATGGGEKERPVWLLLLAVLGGVALLVVGAQLLVEGAVGIAEGFGVSGLVVGLTVVAVGTSDRKSTRLNSSH